MERKYGLSTDTWFIQIPWTTSYRNRILRQHDTLSKQATVLLLKYQIKNTGKYKLIKFFIGQFATEHPACNPWEGL